jgi:radical SAM superfamily enzyme YgiQ (UPF0313 family)
MSIIHVALVYPNVYRVGMGNLGYQFVYGHFNSVPGLSAERFFYPSRPNGSTGRPGPPVSEETGRPLTDFPVVAFSIPFENDYSSVPGALLAAGIPPLQKDRGPRDPLVIAGGVSVSMNPEPLARFLDLAYIGEIGEPSASERLCTTLFEVLQDVSGGLRARDEILERFAQVPGVYVPSAYTFSFDERGLITRISFREGFPERAKAVKRRSPESPVPVSVLFAPEAEFGESMLVETNRGCGRGCRFCAGGWIHFPVRHADFSRFRSSVEQAVREGRRVGLIGSDLASHPELESILKFIVDRGGSFSLSSIRPEGLTPQIIGLLARTGQRTATLAPEVASDRMKGVIGKQIPSQRFHELVGQLVAAGIPNIRFYFMVGLPAESDQDAEEIAQFVLTARRVFLNASRPRGAIGRIGVQVNPFVPKPWTPFQWVAMASQKTLRQRIRLIRDRLKRTGNVVVRAESVRAAIVQGLLSRGDRRIAQRALDAACQSSKWSDILKLAPELLAHYVHREREADEIFPWEVTDHGLPREVLRRSYTKGLSASAME